MVADEIHLVADEERGPDVEGPLPQLLRDSSTRRLLALSAVIDNDEELADWLNIPLLRGTGADRTVGLELRHAVANDLDFAILTVLQRYEDRALVFCCSRGRAERAGPAVHGPDSQHDFR